MVCLLEPLTASTRAAENVGQDYLSVQVMEKSRVLIRDLIRLDKLEPDEDYYLDRLKQGGFRSPAVIADAESADQLAGACHLKVGEAVALYKAAGGGKGGQADGYEDIKNLKAEVLELKITLNRSQQTSRTEQEIGEGYMKATRIVSDFSCLVPVSEDDERLVKAQAAVLSAFGPCEPAGKIFVRSTGPAKRMRIVEEHEQAGEMQIQAGVAGQITSALPPEARLHGHSLMDLIGHDKILSDEEHMQPAVMTLLRAAATAVHSSAYLEDTHKPSCRLSYPNNQPDVTCLAAAGTPSWALVVWTRRV